MSVMWTQRQVSLCLLSQYDTIRFMDVYYCPCDTEGLYCFPLEFFLCAHDNSWTAALNSMKFCTDMYPSNRTKPREFQCHMLKVNVRTEFLDSLPLPDRAKKFVYMITHKPLHSAWWYFARICTLTTARTTLNFKVIGQRSMSFFHK